MKRKLLSLAIAFALLSQTIVSAVSNPLYTYLSGLFALPIISSDTITATVKGEVTPAGGTVFSSSTTANNFDYRASIDMSAVRTAFTERYGVGTTMLSGDSTLTSAFDNSLVTGTFTITFTYSDGISQTDASVTQLADIQLPATSIFKITDVDTSASNTVTVTAKVKDTPVTVLDLNTSLDDFYLDLQGLTATAQNSTISVSMTGYTDISEDGPSTTYGRINYDSNTSSVTVYVPSHTGGSSGGAVTPTPTPTPTPDNNSDININEGGDVTVGGDDKQDNNATTTTETSNGTTVTTTTSSNTSTQKDEDGNSTTTTTTKEVVKETNADTGKTNKVTITETTETTEKAKDGTETTTTTVKETVKETDENTGVTNITTSEITESDANSDATVGTTTTRNTVTKKITVSEKPEEKKGFIENGWSTTPYAAADKDYKGTSELEATVTEVTETTTTVLVDENGEPVLDENGEEQLVTTETTVSEVALYPKYVNITVPDALAPELDANGNALHKVYIAGYPDGEVKPNNNITREEVTAAFDRLLNAVYRETIATTEQNFPDVNDDRWSNDSIATMAKGGFIVGDESGNFNPSKPITRAEFAVIASKFAPSDATPAENYFTDIEGHWAKDFILMVAGQYWISGYGDGSFNPDEPITRAEAMTIINRMLVRYGDGDAEHATQWPDVDKSDWYYESVIEATTHNTYVRTENGWSEKWVEE